MISKDIEKKIKWQARKTTYRNSFFTAMGITFMLHIMLLISNSPPQNSAPAEAVVIDWGMLTLWLLKEVPMYLFIYSIPAFIYAPFPALFGSSMRKRYFALMQEHIYEVMATTNDAVEIQKLQLAMSYYGNLNSVQHMKEVRAAAASAAWASSSSSSHAEVNIHR